MYIAHEMKSGKPLFLGSGLWFCKKYQKGEITACTYVLYEFRYQMITIFGEISSKPYSNTTLWVFYHLLGTLPIL